MKKQPMAIANIPAIIWGEKLNKVYVHVHGKMSRKEYAEHFAKIAEQHGYQTLSFDLPEHGERMDKEHRCDVWSGMHDLSEIAGYAFDHWQDVSMYACSIGAYFSLNTYADKPFTKCLFQSPILNMSYLIQQMFQWFGVDAQRLQAEKEIDTPVDLLRWDYYQYVMAHPITFWPIPTAILYGALDNLQSLEVIQVFAKEHNCQLTVSPNSEHPFMAPEDEAIVTRWLEEHI